RERVRSDMTGLHALKPIVANRRGGVHALFHVSAVQFDATGYESALLHGAVSPDAGESHCSGWSCRESRQTGRLRESGFSVKSPRDNRPRKSTPGVGQPSTRNTSSGATRPRSFFSPSDRARTLVFTR